MRIVLGHKLKTLRGEKSQTMIAKMMGISQPCWQSWEADTREPNATTIRDICQKFGCTADWLLGLSAISAPVNKDSKSHRECPQCIDKDSLIKKLVATNERLVVSNAALAETIQALYSSKK